MEQFSKNENNIVENEISNTSFSHPQKSLDPFTFQESTNKINTIEKKNSSSIHHFQNDDPFHSSVASDPFSSNTNSQIPTAAADTFNVFPTPYGDEQPSQKRTVQLISHVNENKREPCVDPFSTSSINQSNPFEIITNPNPFEIAEKNTSSSFPNSFKRVPIAISSNLKTRRTPSRTFMTTNRALSNPFENPEIFASNNDAMSNFFFLQEKILGFQILCCTV